MARRRARRPRHRARRSAGMPASAGNRCRPHARAPLHEDPVLAQPVPVEAALLVGDRGRDDRTSGMGASAPLEAGGPLLGERLQPLGGVVGGEAVLGVALALVAKPGVDAVVLRPERVEHLLGVRHRRAGSSRRSPRASSSPASRSASSSTQRLTRPHATASSASRKRPLKISSLARSRPIAGEGASGPAAPHLAEVQVAVADARGARPSRSRS